MNKILVTTISIVLGIFVLVLIKPWISDKEQLADLAPSVFECKGNGVGEACNKLLEVGISPELLQVNARYEREVSDIIVRNKSEEMETLVDFTYQYAALNKITLPESYTQKWSKPNTSPSLRKDATEFHFISNTCPAQSTPTASICQDLLKFGVSPELLYRNTEYRDEITGRAAAAKNENKLHRIKDLDVFTHEFASKNGITLPDDYIKQWPNPAR